VTRPLGAARALLLIVLVALAAAAFGYAVGRESKPPVKTAEERVLSPAPPPPSLPAYDPGSGWFALPKPPSPAPVENGAGGEASEPYEEGGGVVEESTNEEPVKEESGGGGSGERCFGIGFGNNC
jgi:hypothetical protein